MSSLGIHIATKEALFLVSSNVCLHFQAGAWKREKNDIAVIAESIL